MITIKEIAEQLRVSPTTVSNVLNGRSSKMSADTCKKVREALVKYKYVTNDKHNHTAKVVKKVVVGYFMASNDNIMLEPFHSEVLGAIERALRPHGKMVLYAIFESEKELLRILLDDTVEGAVIIAYNPGQCAQLVREMPKPIVFLDSGEGAYDNIGLQDYEGAYAATEYLINQGHRRIAFFCPQPYPPLASYHERLRGFEAALAKGGILFEKKGYHHIPPDRNVCKEMLRQFARNKIGTHYTAVFFANDIHANEAINIFYGQGFTVPRDISVIGFDDSVYAKLSRPAVTTIRQSPTEKGNEAVKLLLRRIRGEEVAVRSIQLATELIVRESVKNIGR